MLAIIFFALLIAGNILVSMVIDSLKENNHDVWLEYGKPTSPTDIHFVSSFIFFSEYRNAGISENICKIAAAAKWVFCCDLILGLLLVLT